MLYGPANVPDVQQVMALLEGLAQLQANRDTSVAKDLRAMLTSLQEARALQDVLLQEAWPLKKSLSEAFLNVGRKGL